MCWAMGNDFNALGGAFYLFRPGGLVLNRLKHILLLHRPYTPFINIYRYAQDIDYIAIFF